MEDNYIEWIVKRKAPFYALPVKFFVVVACILSVFLALITLLGILCLIAALVAAYFIFLSLHVEFEYLYADGGLRVDRILGKSRRKELFDCEKSNVEFVAREGDASLKPYEREGMTVLDCSTRQKGAEVYAMICKMQSGTVKVLFEPNERIVAAMRRNYPRRIGF